MNKYLETKVIFYFVLSIKLIGINTAIPATDRRTRTAAPLNAMHMQVHYQLSHGLKS